MLITPVALNFVNAAEYLGTTTAKFRALVKAGHIRPLPVLDSFAVADLDALTESLRRKSTEHPSGEIDYKAAAKELLKKTLGTKDGKNAVTDNQSAVQQSRDAVRAGLGLPERRKPGRPKKRDSG